MAMKLQYLVICLRVYFRQKGEFDLRLNHLFLYLNNIGIHVIRTVFIHIEGNYDSEFKHRKTKHKKNQSTLTCKLLLFFLITQNKCFSLKLCSKVNANVYMQSYFNAFCKDKAWCFRMVSVDQGPVLLLYSSQNHIHLWHIYMQPFILNCWMSLLIQCLFLIQYFGIAE